MTKYCYSEHVSFNIKLNCKYFLVEVALKLHAAYK